MNLEYPEMNEQNRRAPNAAKCTNIAVFYLKCTYKGNPP